MQSSRAKVTISLSATTMDISSRDPSPSESEKTPKRISNSAKVMFQEPASLPGDEKRESSAALLEITSPTDQKLRYNTKDVSSIVLKREVGEDASNGTIAGSHDVLKDIDATTRKQMISHAELSRPPSGPFKGSDKHVNQDRGSNGRGPGFRGYTIDGISARYPASRPRLYLDEVETALRTTNQTSTVNSETRTHCSENLGVRSMLFDTPETDALPLLEAAAFEVILQEALDFLDILERTIPAPVDERWDDSYKTIDETYGRPEEPEIMFREDMGLLPLIPTVSQKIQRDRTYVYNVLEGTNRDIRCLRRYDRLETEVDDVVRTLEGEHSLEVNNEIWMGQVKQLRELIASNESKNVKEAENLFASTGRMDKEIDEATFLNNSKLGYVERWEEARLEQQKLRLEIKERESNDALGECEMMEKADRIVSAEVRTFLQANTKDLEDETVVWTSRCNEEVERLERDINDMKENIEIQKLELQNLYELRDERQAFLNECYEEKERIKNEEDYWIAVNDAATVIQTMWRGYMVRHELGQYKDLWITLKKRKRRAALIRKKNEEWGKQKEAEWGSTELKKLKNIVDPNA